MGTRRDFAMALEFAAEGKVRSHIHEARLADSNSIFTHIEASDRLSLQ
jgi:propanol-preferring alcohol dehydrogenase